MTASVSGVEVGAWSAPFACRVHRSFAGPAAVGALADVAGAAAPFTVLGVVALVVMAAAVILGRQASSRGCQLG